MSLPVPFPGKDCKYLLESLNTAELKINQSINENCNSFIKISNRDRTKENSKQIYSQEAFIYFRAF